MSFSSEAAKPSPGRMDCLASITLEAALPVQRALGAQRRSGVSLSCRSRKPVAMASSSSQRCRTCSNALSRSSRTATATQDSASPRSAPRCVAHSPIAA
eukprot:6154363-Pyramimonas_sp.AAC.1